MKPVLNTSKMKGLLLISFKPSEHILTFDTVYVKAMHANVCKGWEKWTDFKLLSLAI